jgi:hypothetical protein
MLNANTAVNCSMMYKTIEILIDNVVMECQKEINGQSNSVSLGVGLNALLIDMFAISVHLDSLET